MLRLERLAAAIQSTNSRADALLVTHPTDVRYLTDFTGSNAALIVPAKRPPQSARRQNRKPILFTDGRYTAQARQQTKGAEVIIAQKPVLREACAWMMEQGMRHCAIDSAQTTVAALEAMRKALPSNRRRGFFLPVHAITAGLREIKDAGEVRRLRAAARLGCRLFEGVLPRIVTGKREFEVAADLEFAARVSGAEAMSFETILAGGARSALPHGKAGKSRLPRRGFVVLDFGVLLDGYCSDMTRTVHLGPATVAEHKVYDAVLEAQEAAIACVRPGATCGEVDEAARAVLRRTKLERAKMADFFTHSTGHGVGLEIHEGPYIASRQQQKLEAGMVITIEPGVYIPGRFGVRIEDMVLVTPRGSEVLTPSPKAWIGL